MKLEETELKKRRVLKGITQQEIADMLEISTSTYRSYDVDDKIPLKKHTRDKICEILDCDESDLWRYKK